MDSARALASTASPFVPPPGLTTGRASGLPRALATGAAAGAAAGPEGGPEGGTATGTAAGLAAGPAGAPTIVSALGPDKLEALKKVSQEFESMVLKERLAPMFEGLDTDGLGGGGAGEAMFRPMLVDNYAKGMASSGGIGIADSVFKELVRMQGGGTDGFAG